MEARINSNTWYSFTISRDGGQAFLRYLSIRNDKWYIVTECYPAGALVQWDWQRWTPINGLRA